MGISSERSKSDPFVDVVISAEKRYPVVLRASLRSQSRPWTMLGRADIPPSPHKELEEKQCNLEA
jgi:hypothetical protein